MMSTPSVLLIFGFGFSVFSFVLWKRLKDDYPENWIFSLTTLAGLGVLAATFVATVFITDQFFWFVLFGLVAATLVSQIKVKIRIGDLLDSLTPASFIFLAILYLTVIFKSSDYLAIHLSNFVLSVLGFFLFFFFERNYRKITWYLSGKHGFSGIATLLVFFYLKAIVVYFFLSVILFRGIKTFEFILSALLGIILTVFLYTRSGRKFSQDLKLIKIWQK